jgi:uncharacterized membrane protein (TIGR02234 family)
MNNGSAGLDPRPALWLGAVGTVLGYLLAQLGAVLTWARATYETDLRGPITVTGSGNDVAPGAVWTAVTALAAVGAAFALRGRWRRVMGAVIGFLGLATVGFGVRGLFHDPVNDLKPAGVLDAGARAGIVATGPLLMVAGGLVMIAGGVLLAAKSTAGGVSARHDRAAAPARLRPAAADPDLQMWRDLDEHRDPTSRPGPSADAAGPDAGGKAQPI